MDPKLHFCILSHIPRLYILLLECKMKIVLSAVTILGIATAASAEIDYSAVRGQWTNDVHGTGRFCDGKPIKDSLDDAQTEFSLALSPNKSFLAIYRNSTMRGMVRSSSGTYVLDEKKSVLKLKISSLRLNGANVPALTEEFSYKLEPGGEYLVLTQRQVHGSGCAGKIEIRLRRGTVPSIGNLIED